MRHWKKLLHFGENRSRVVSEAFFLSPKGNVDYLAELDKTIELLNSDHGRDIACNFPARYQWLHATRKGIPTYDLHQCPELNEFMSGFQMKTINIAFASEYPDKPVSSFGHTMLVFHDPDQPLLSADVIHFAAKTDVRDGMFTYVYKGITGGYPGYFFRDPLFKKQFQYNIQEQRYIHLYQLNFSTAQIKNIIYHLFELRKATYDYYFINANCAYQIATLLDIATDDTSFSESGFVLPIEVASIHRHDYTAKRVLYPSTIILRHLLAQMNESQHDRFESVITGEAEPVNTLSNTVKYALNLYYEYDFRVNHISHPNYSKVMLLTYNTPPLNIATPEPLDRQGFSRVSVSYMRQADDESMLFSYRPFLTDLYDVPPKNEEAYELSLFSPVIQFTHSTASVYQLDIFNIKSLPARSRYFKPLSWHFYTGFNRRNPTAELNYEIEFGMGMTQEVSIFRLSYALNGGFDFSTGDYYYKPNAILLTRLSEHSHMGIEFNEKYYAEKKYIERNIFAGIRFDEAALQASYTTKSYSKEAQIILSLSGYFN